MPVVRFVPLARFVSIACRAPIARCILFARFVGVTSQRVYPVIMEGNAPRGPALQFDLVPQRGVKADARGRDVMVLGIQVEVG